MLYWDDEHPYGYVSGYRLYQNENSINAPQKGLKYFSDANSLHFKSGTKIGKTRMEKKDDVA